MAGIFINYRTGDGEEAAVALDGELLKVFGKNRVFRDRRSMGAGTDFPPKLRRELEKSTVLLVLIGSEWLRLKDESTGRRRIDLARDYVREEIRTSLEQQKLVIPVLLGLGSVLPGADELPKDIAQLSQRQTVLLRVPYLHTDVKPLIKELRQYVPVKKKSRGAGKGWKSGGGTYVEKAERSVIAQRDGVYYENAPVAPAESAGRVRFADPANPVKPKSGKSRSTKSAKSAKSAKREGAS
ncbi:toll/interleukin-1 receptor domain-containing protein [Streptomyces sp. NPDC057552]|uniref:toll/interleukin-1 receptor domain-containing protein n=1 Tax=Streptomyces sp. NPDC057552 TaxID=3350537 RepID=UPI003682883E